MKDARTMAYINLFAVLGALPYLCELDSEAAKLIEGKSVSVGFAVKDGPSATLFFGGGKCRMVPGVDRCEVKLPFSSILKYGSWWLQISAFSTVACVGKGFPKIYFLIITVLLY